MSVLVFSRVRGMLISPEVRNAIHVGDRILEINGLPVDTLMEQQVRFIFLSYTSGMMSFFFSWNQHFTKHVVVVQHFPTALAFDIFHIPQSFVHSSAGKGRYVKDLKGPQPRPCTAKHSPQLPSVTPQELSTFFWWRSLFLLELKDPNSSSDSHNDCVNLQNTPNWFRKRVHLAFLFLSCSITRK